MCLRFGITRKHPQNDPKSHLTVFPRSGKPQGGENTYFPHTGAATEGGHFAGLSTQWSCWSHHCLAAQHAFNVTSIPSVGFYNASHGLTYQHPETLYLPCPFMCLRFDITTKHPQNDPKFYLTVFPRSGKPPGGENTCFPHTGAASPPTGPAGAITA